MPDDIKTPEAAPAAVPAPAPEVAPVVDPAGEAALGDAGKRALDDMKGKWHSERDQRKALEARVAELESKPVTDPRADRRIVRAEVKAAAKGLFADPADALVFIDLDQFEVSEDGEVDSEKLSAAITELLTKKPHLGAAATQPEKRFQGSGDGGAQGRKSGPDQLTREDLKGKSPEWIAKAKADGRLNKVLGITQ